ncbi:hypothetical protein NG819_15215 [Pseudarthrobacter sp. Fe7]|nr:hypothetical protein NG819_15215 [Pseudarthrobacter sp. Fe7]
MAASPVAPVTVDFPGGGDHATPIVETPRAAVFTAKSSASTAALSRQFVGVTAFSAPRAAASMNDDRGASPQSPTRLPSVNLPSPVSGSAGASGPTGAGAQAAADLSHRFVLPMTQGGEGSLFSFVLPGPPAQDPGFSPD